MTSNFSMRAHINATLSSCQTTLFALRTLCQHGMNTLTLQTVFSSVIAAKIMYGSPAQYGFTDLVDHAFLDSLLRKSKKCGFNSAEDDFNSRCTSADNQFFNTIISDTRHVLYPLLSPKVIQTHNLARHRINSWYQINQQSYQNAILSLVYYTPTRGSNNIIGCLPINVVIFFLSFFNSWFLFQNFLCLYSMYTVVACLLFAEMNEYYYYYYTLYTVMILDQTTYFSCLLRIYSGRYIHGDKDQGGGDRGGAGGSVLSDWSVQ